MESEITSLEISGDGMPETADTRAGFKPPEPKSTAATPRDASLDGLPAELKISILHFAPNIAALQTLVQSSPLYHKVYLDDRKVILSSVLLRDIGPQVLPDALAVYKASQIGYAGSVSRKERVESFISQYKEERESSSLAMCDSLDMGTLESLSRLQSVVSKITSDFCEATLSIHPVTGERIQPHGELSINEKRRIYRALYRFELFRALFDDPLGVEIPPESRHCFDAMDQSLLFLSVFQIWEVEEVACVRDYIIRRHTEILLESSSEIHKLRPNKDLHDEYWQIQNTGYLMSLGLLFLCRLLNTSSPAQKASILEYNIFCDCWFLTRALEEDSYNSVYPTDMYTAAEEGQELRFEDDSLVDGPNAAWPWSTNQKVGVLYFQEFKQPLREWAYVMWDISRLEDWRILNVSIEQACNEKDIFSF